MKNKVFIVAVCILAFFIVIGCTPKQSYFPEFNQFTASITENPSNTGPILFNQFPSPIKAKYVKKEIVNDMRESNDPWSIVKKTAYIFKTISTNIQVYVLVPTGMTDTMSLISGEIYLIEYEIHYGWPTTYGLVISQEQKLIFAGISRWSVSDKNEFTHNLNFDIHQNRILSDNYIEGAKDDFWIKKTNIEVTFSLNGKLINLYQGQSATLENYNIILLIAREIEYKPNWYDTGQNCISYIITKNNN